MQNNEGRVVTVLLLKKGKKNLFSKAQAILKRIVEEEDGEINTFSGYALYLRVLLGTQTCVGAYELQRS